MINAMKHTKNNPATDSRFREAVEATQDISEGYRPGLGALREYSGVICAKQTRGLEGSVDIDTCTRDLYPEDPRWDYAVGCQGKVYYVEVHPAYTSQVKKMLEKKEWLKEWLAEKAPLLDDIPKANPPFYWVATEAGVNILRGSKEYRKLAVAKLLPRRKLEIK